VLKKRIIPVQLLLDGRLVKTKQFGAYRDVGDPVASSRVYNAQNADELVFLNINRSARGIDPLLTLLERVSEVTFMPLSLGGGVTSYDSAARLIRSGADKVVLNFFWLQNRTPGKKQEIDAVCRDNTLTVTTTTNVTAATVLLDGRLVDFGKPVKFRINDQETSRKLQPTVLALCQGLIERGDPELAFTARIDLPLSAPTSSTKPRVKGPFTSRGQH